MAKYRNMRSCEHECCGFKECPYHRQYQDTGMKPLFPNGDPNKCEKYKKQMKD